MRAKTSARKRSLWCLLLFLRFWALFVPYLGQKRQGIPFLGLCPKKKMRPEQQVYIWIGLEDSYAVPEEVLLVQVARRPHSWALEKFLVRPLHDTDGEVCRCVSLRTSATFCMSWSSRQSQPMGNSFFSLVNQRVRH